MDKKLSVKAVTTCALLVAMSVIIGIFCKNFMNFAGGLFRVTFENLPIILSGILFGPFVGGFVGVATDFISYFLSAQIYPPNLIVTFGAMSIGLVSGIISKYVFRKRGYAQIIVSAACAHLIGSVVIKSIGLFTFYSWAILWRIPLYFLIATLEIVLLCMLYKNKSFRRLIENVGKRD
jgi:ECF transporter S component (folate family)